MHESVTLGNQNIYAENTPAAIHASCAKIVDTEANFHEWVTTLWCLEWPADGGNGEYFQGQW